jgi:hypothetical protein
VPEHRPSAPGTRAPPGGGAAAAHLYGDSSAAQGSATVSRTVSWHLPNTIASARVSHMGTGTLSVRGDSPPPTSRSVRLDAPPSPPIAALGLAGGSPASTARGDSPPPIIIRWDSPPPGSQGVLPPISRFAAVSTNTYASGTNTYTYPESLAGYSGGSDVSGDFSHLRMPASYAAWMPPTTLGLPPPPGGAPGQAQQPGQAGALGSSGLSGGSPQPSSAAVGAPGQTQSPAPPSPGLLGRVLQTFGTRSRAGSEALGASPQAGGPGRATNPLALVGSPVPGILSTARGSSPLRGRPSASSQPASPRRTRPASQVRRSGSATSRRGGGPYMAGADAGMVLSMQPSVDDEAALAAAAAAAMEGAPGGQHAGPRDGAALQTTSGGAQGGRRTTRAGTAPAAADTCPADPMFASPFVAMSWGTGAMIASMPPTVCDVC